MDPEPGGVPGEARRIRPGGDGRSPRSRAVGVLAGVIAVPSILVVVAAVSDLISAGPVAPKRARDIAVVALVLALAAVYLGAWARAEFDPAGAVARMPRTLVVDMLGAAALLLLSFANHLPTGGPGGGGGVHTGPVVPRTNFATSLLDPAEAADALGVPSVRIAPKGFTTSVSSGAELTGLNARGLPCPPHLYVTVWQGPSVDAQWDSFQRRGVPVGGVGDAAVAGDKRFGFRRGDTMVTFTLYKAAGDPREALARVATIAEKRLA